VHTATALNLLTLSRLFAIVSTLRNDSTLRKEWSALSSDCADNVRTESAFQSRAWCHNLML